jgi:hypothetical protein
LVAQFSNTEDAPSSWLRRFDGSAAAPSSLAQAISPLLGAVILEFGGATEILFSLCGVALANVMLVGLLALTSSRLGSKRRPVFGDAVDENQ